MSELREQLLAAKQREEEKDARIAELEAALHAARKNNKDKTPASPDPMKREPGNNLALVAAAQKSEAELSSTKRKTEAMEQEIRERDALEQIIYESDVEYNKVLNLLFIFIVIITLL